MPKHRKKNEAEDYVKFVAQATVPGVVLRAREVERASAKDPELQELEKCIRSRKWEDCKCTRYKIVRDELCMISHPDHQYLTVPPFHSSVFKSTKHFGLSFAFDAPKTWNELPQDVRCATSVASFRSKLKTYLFAKAYPP